MRLRQLFEDKPAKRIVAVMPGGFHPFHPGHKSLYDWAVETFGKANVYVAATNDTKARPFPFDVKQKLAAMAGVPTQRFIQVKSPFNALAYESIIGNASDTALIFIRSEKDKTSHPLPDQVRKSDGNMGYLISYKDSNDLETADTHGYMAYGPTIDFDFSGMSIKSASELRAAWPEMSDEDKLQAADLMYPGNGQTAVKLLDNALGTTEMEPAEDASEEEEDEFHTALDKLVHKTFGHSSDEKKAKKEEAPPGREKQVKALKKEFPDDEGAPYAIAWAQHNKHGKPKNENVQGALPQKIDVVPMPTPPQAPTADTPDGTDDNGTRTSTTPKGNRSVKNGGGTYIFTPQGKLMLYMSPKIGGLQQTHNLTKKTVTVNFGTSVDQGDGDVNVSQKGTYDMQGNLISQDNTNVASGGYSIDLDKDKGTTIDYRVSDRDTVSANSRTGVSIRRNDADGNPIQAASNGSR